jgi:hypothetical protein
MGNGVYLSRSQSSSEDSTARKKFTISGWYKLADNGDAGGWKGFWSAAVDNNNYSSLKQNADGYIIFEQKSSGTGVTWTSSGRYRDYCSWYHIVVAYDSAQASNTDRVKVYINGEQAAGTYGSFTQDQEGFWGNSSATAGVGRYNNNTGNSYMYTGYMTHVVCTIGYALAPTVFGETDATTGMWKVRGAPSGITYSANGFFLKFENSGTMGADSSGNNNTFTVNGTGGSNGTLVQVTDVPDNNFATINPIDVGRNFDQTEISEGSLKSTSSGTTTNNGDQIVSSMGFAKGKWYWEIKLLSNADSLFIGVFNDVLGGRAPYHENYFYGIYGDGTGSHSQIYQSQEGGQRGYGTDSNPCFSNNDICQVAFDCDNYRLYIGKNGLWTDDNAASGGSITSGSAFNQSTPTGYYQISTAAAQAGFYRSAVVKAGSSVQFSAQYNFGNPQFTIASSNSDANGHGSFEYAVPSGFYALCTKNLNTYG